MLGFRRRLAGALSVMSTVLMWSGLVCPVGAEEPAAVSRYDRRILSEIARDVVRGGAPAVNQSVG
jgi:hypothetical protein